MHVLAALAALALGSGAAATTPAPTVSRLSAARVAELQDIWNYYAKIAEKSDARPAIKLARLNADGNVVFDFADGDRQTLAPQDFAANVCAMATYIGTKTKDQSRVAAACVKPDQVPAAPPPPPDPTPIQLTQARADELVAQYNKSAIALRADPDPRIGGADNPNDSTIDSITIKPDGTAQYTFSSGRAWNGIAPQDFAAIICAQTTWSQSLVGADRGSACDEFAERGQLADPPGTPPGPSVGRTCSPDDECAAVSVGSDHRQLVCAQLSGGTWRWFPYDGQSGCAAQSSCAPAAACSN